MINLRITIKKVEGIREMKNKWENAVSKGLEMAMFVWEGQAKLLTTMESHVITGRYRASINLNRSDGFAHETVTETKADDGVHDKIRYDHYRGGTNVEYAGHLEKRYSILARAIDKSKTDMIKLFGETVKNNI